jgi:hypothetical protein
MALLIRALFRLSIWAFFRWLDSHRNAGMAKKEAA